MIYNYTKCESVIAKIMADLDSSEVKQRITDIREWIFEAVDKIGAPMQYLSRESGSDGVPVFKIQDHQIPIPSDLVILDAVAYSQNENGPWVPVLKSSNVFKEPKRKPKKHNMYDPNNKAIDRTPEPPMPEEHHLITSQSQLYTINGMKYYEKMVMDPKYGKPEYFIKPGWIVLNKENGYVKLAYKAIAVDERGYPLIPDLTSYQEAIYWYVVMKLTFPKWFGGKLGGSSKYAQKYAANTYQYTQQQWNFYRNQAYAEAMMPTADDMRAIKNEWNKLIPEWDADDTFFKDSNKAQITYNDYYRGY